MKFSCQEMTSHVYNKELLLLMIYDHDLNGNNNRNSMRNEVWYLLPKFAIQKLKTLGNPIVCRNVCPIV